jgi:hypothetical protein
MTSEFNALLPISHTEKVQVWIIGNRDQVVQTMNELYVRQFAPDRAKFTPIIPLPYTEGKYMSVLVR